MAQSSLVVEFDEWEQRIRDKLAECCLDPDASARLIWQHPRIAKKIVNESLPLSETAIQSKIKNLHSNLTRSSRNKREIYLADLFAVYKFTEHTPDYWLLGKRSPAEDLEVLSKYAEKDGDIVKYLIENNPCMHNFIKAYYKYPTDFKISRIVLPKNTVFLHVFFSEIVDKFQKAFWVDKGMFKFDLRHAKFDPDCYELISTDILGRENEKAVSIIKSEWFNREHQTMEENATTLSEYRKKRRKVYNRYADNSETPKEEDGVPVRWTYEKQFEMSVSLCLLLCAISSLRKVSLYQLDNIKSDKGAIETYLATHTDVRTLIIEFLVNSFLQVNQDCFYDYMCEDIMKNRNSIRANSADEKVAEGTARRDKPKTDSLAAIIEQANSR